MKLFFLLLIFQLSYSNKISAKATLSSNEVGLGEVFQILVEVKSDKKLTNIQWPILKGNLVNFSIQKNHGTSQNSYTRIINGKVHSENNIINNFTFNLTPKKKGIFRVGPIIFRYQNYTKNLGQFEIKVIEKGQGIDVFSKSSKQKVYLGEPFLYSIDIFIRKQVRNVNVPDFKKTIGHQFKMVQLTKKIVARNKIINGRSQQVASINFMLWPLITGNITIPTIPIIYQELTQRNNSRFFRQRAVQKTAYSNPQNIQVINLNNPPNNFSGAIGDHTVQVKIDKSNLSVGEVLTYTIILRGEGNFSTIDLPILELEDFEVFKPEITTQEQVINNKFITTQTIKYVVIPNQEGMKLIKPYEFVYFDPKNKIYKTIKSNSYQVKVSKGKISKDIQGYSNIPQNIKFKDKDIRYIKTVISKLNINKALAIDSFIYYFLYIIALIIFFSWLFYQYKNNQLKNNNELFRKRNAKKQAKERLQKVEGLLEKEDLKLFYKELVHTLERFLSDKYNIEVRGLKNNQLMILLKKNGVSADNIKDIKNILDISELVQFGSLSFDKTKISNDYDMVKEIVNSMDKE